jgi:release factor glutamine methyltransferase
LKVPSPEEPWTILRVLDWTAERFARQGLASPRLDAEVLLGHALGMERIRLYMEHDKPLAERELARARELVRRRLAHEPVASLTGVRVFGASRVRVVCRVLRPRPATALLVEPACELLARRPEPLVVDVGTGSGAILLALRRELPGAKLVGIDVSAEALEVARHNLRSAGLEAGLLEGDLLEPLLADLRPDLVVSNPPYVPSAELARLSPEVRDWEPVAALDGGADGLMVIRRLVAQAAARLAPGGWLVVEIGHDQAARVVDLLRAAGFAELEVRKDLAGLDRVVVGRR